MFKRSVILTTAMIFILGMFLASGLVIASDAGPDEMVLKSAAAKKPANFPHKKHQENEIYFRKGRIDGSRGSVGDR